MMTTSRFLVSSETATLATRVGGSELRARLLGLLDDTDHVTVDLDEMAITPSFADEFLGGTLELLGRDEFKRRVSIVNLSESAKPLVRHILNQRAKESELRGLHLAQA